MSQTVDKNSAWGGRFQESTDAFVQEFTASVEFDKKMAMQDIAGSLAHCEMLCAQGILSKEDAEAIREGLLQIRTEILEGRFQWQVALEDVHMNIEKRLTDLVGVAGKRLHTGRSRNDQVATDIRLFVRDAIDEVLQEIRRFQRGIVALAEREVGTIMPGFTHLQTAQPVSFAHHLLAWYEMLDRDYGRFVDCRARLNVSPLGAAALAGTSYPIDRALTASILGFDGVCENSLDAVSDRDFAIEFCAAASLLMMHLSRMAEEMIIWNSAPFRFIDLPDRFCTGSSIMPQKKNPDVPELVRGKTGRVYGHLMALLTLMKGQVLAYNKDNQEDKEPLFDCVKTVKDCLRAFADMVVHIEPLRENMLRAAKQGFSTATDLADYLVRRGMAFRDAHEVVGKAVALSVARACDLADLPLEALQALSGLIAEDVYEVLTVEGSVAARNHIGGTAPEAVAKQIEKIKNSLYADA